MRFQAYSNRSKCHQPFSTRYEPRQFASGDTENCQGSVLTLCHSVDQAAPTKTRQVGSMPKPKHLRPSLGDGFLIYPSRSRTIRVHLTCIGNSVATLFVSSILSCTMRYGVSFQAVRTGDEEQVVCFRALPAHRTSTEGTSHRGSCGGATIPTKAAHRDPIGHFIPLMLRSGQGERSRGGSFSS